MRVGLGVEHRDSRRQSVVSPHFQDMGDQLRLLVQVCPRCFAPIIGIVLEGHEGEVRQALMRLQVFEKSPEPGVLAARVFPHLDVLRHPLKNGAPSFNPGSTA